jgi:hypothetical protein
MCWTIIRAAGKFGGISGMRAFKALGPPVDEPMMTTLSVELNDLVF